MHLLLLLFNRLTPVLPEVKAAGGFDEAFFPPFLRSASTAHSLWATVSSDLCQTVILLSSPLGHPTLFFEPRSIYLCLEFRLDAEDDHCRFYL